MTDAPLDALAAPWGEHPLEAGETLALELGPLRVRVRSTGDEIWLDHDPGGRRREARRPGSRPDGEEDWIRWPVPETAEAVRLVPRFPPRPVVAEPDRSFRLLPRTRARIFVRVPLWVRVEAGAGDPRPLTEVPSVVLSDTWWGGFTDGELCYWLRTTARRRVPPDVHRPHLAVCPLELRNRSDEELPVERIVLRVAHLSLFARDDHLWADETRVHYRGPEEPSEIEVSGARPEEAADAVRVADPREPPPHRGFRALTVARLRSLPGLGGL